MVQEMGRMQFTCGIEDQVFETSVTYFWKPLIRYATDFWSFHLAVDMNSNKTIKKW